MNTNLTPLQIARAEARFRIREERKANRTTVHNFPKTWRQLCARWGYRCLKCGRKEGDGFKLLTRDHVLPASKGGSGSLDNTQPLCPRCNVGKRDEHIDYRETKGADALRVIAMTEHLERRSLSGAERRPE